jgi:glycerol uptake facilitator protein
LLASGSFYFVAQLIGAMLGAFLVWLSHKDHFAATKDEGGKLA